MTLHIANSDILSKGKYRYNRLHALANVDYSDRMKLRLKELRKAIGLTQKQVAEIAGISVSYYTELEGGKKTINANRMEAIAKALRVSPSELILDGGNQEHDELIQHLMVLDGPQKKILLDLARSLASNSDKAD